MKQVIAIIRPYLAEKGPRELAAGPTRSVQLAKSKDLEDRRIRQYSAGEFKISLYQLEILMWVEDFA